MKHFLAKLVDQKRALAFAKVYDLCQKSEDYALFNDELYSSEYLFFNLNSYSQREYLLKKIPQEHLVLDLGCGLGSMSYYFKNYLGVDLFNNPFKKHDYKKADIRSLSLKMMFDTILAIDSLYPVPSKRSLKKILKHLNINGQFLWNQTFYDQLALDNLINSLSPSKYQVEVIEFEEDHKKFLEQFQKSLPLLTNPVLKKIKEDELKNLVIKTGRRLIIRINVLCHDNDNISN